MGLRLCDACERHVRDRETRCPFCDASLTPMIVPPPVVVRTSRALQAVVIAASLTGCREERNATPEPAPAPSPVVTDTATSVPIEVDATKAEEPDTTAPAPSSTPSHTAAPVPTPTAKPAVTVHRKPYGAPPADGLLV